MISELVVFILRYQRDWRFHKSDGNWLTRSQYGGVKEQTGSYEKGQYNVFDPLQWRKIPKELKLEYKELEERPKLPAIAARSPARRRGVPRYVCSISQALSVRVHLQSPPRHFIALYL
ncbi:hypothetical protein Y032_0068g206 [Ancylostoma ceylanicum]|nr:hypothetical protein Y032_0068g206 [Ancylostoma ceylanicum]